MGIHGDLKANSLNSRMFQSTLAALAMALRKIKLCSLTKEIIVHTKRRNIIEAMQPKRLKSLNRKTNGNALMILECHGIINSVALTGALVSFQ